MYTTRISTKITPRWPCRVSQKPLQCTSTSFTREVLTKPNKGAVFSKASDEVACAGVEHIDHEDSMGYSQPDVLITMTVIRVLNASL